MSWPKLGDIAFTVAVRDGAHIDPYGHGRFVLMIAGYKEAADVLIQKSTEVGWYRDTLVYPIIFSYRQFIELSLKYLIATYGPSKGISANWSSHDIAELWKQFQVVEDAYGVEDPDATNPSVKAIIEEFAKVDPRSFSFRYPVDRDGNLIQLGINDLDLGRLKEIMNAVKTFFDGCDGYLDNLSDCGL